MAEPLQRTQILLRKDQHVALRDLASREGTSLSELIRMLVDEALERRNNEAEARTERRLRALERIEEHARAAQERRGGRPLEINPAEVIRQLREERDDELVQRLTPAGDRR